jgi:hypothetical protein
MNNIKDFDVNIPIHVVSLKEHFEIKPVILDLIEKSVNEKLVNATEMVSKTDWRYSNSSDRKYLNFVMPFLQKNLFEVCKKYNSIGLKIGNAWFQQYLQDDVHEWHIHGYSHLSAVYFLEIPNNTIKTEIKDLSNNIIQYEANEGDIVIFPSFLYHRSPMNKTKSRKTIISLNIDLSQKYSEVVWRPHNI